MGSNFVDCVLRPITFIEVDFTLASFVKAPLYDLKLGGQRFRETNLSEADLRNTDLSQADLMGARLLDAKLDGADLRGAKIDANGLRQAKLAGALIDIDTAIAFAAAYGLVVS